MRAEAFDFRHERKPIKSRHLHIAQDGIVFSYPVECDGGAPRIGHMDTHLRQMNRHKFLHAEQTYRIVVHNQDARRIPGALLTRALTLLARRKDLSQLLAVRGVRRNHRQWWSSLNRDVGKLTGRTFGFLGVARLYQRYGSSGRVAKRHGDRKIVAQKLSEGGLSNAGRQIGQKE